MRNQTTIPKLNSCTPTTASCCCLVVAILALLVPAAAMAKGECKVDRQKLCENIAKEHVVACLDKRMAELGEACKTQREAEAKKKNAEDSAKMVKEEGTHAESGHGALPESDTSKVDQPERRKAMNPAGC